MHTLTRMGFCRKLRKGQYDHIKFSSICVGDDARHAAHETDTGRVPHGIKLDQVISDKTLHELTIAIKHRVLKGP